MKTATSRVPRPPLCGTTISYPLGMSPDLTLERALEGISKAGLHYVELAAIPGYCPHVDPTRMPEHEARRLATLCGQYNLAPRVLNAATDLTTDAGITILASALEFCQALGVQVLVTAVQNTDTEEGLASFMDRADSICLLAERHECVIALETHRGYVNSGVQGAKLLKSIGSEWLRINYDMANVYNRGGVLPHEDLLQLGGDIGALIAHVHLKDKGTWVQGDRSFPQFGKGILDFGRVLSLLHDGGYRGAMTLEVEIDGKGGTQVIDRVLADSLSYLSQFWTPETSNGA